VPQALQEQRVQQVGLGTLELPVKLGLQEILVPQVTQAQPDQQALPDLQVQLDLLVQQEQREQRVQLDLPELLVKLEQQDLRVLPAILELLVTLALLDQLGQRVQEILALREQQVPLEPMRAADLTKYSLTYL
jgi:hypothetical protein